jgi:two-component system, OmpR family, sensor kinase
VLVGFAQLVQRAMTTLRSAYWQQQEELTVAALHMERASELAAERSHELRNGLAGLAGITHLLSTEADGEDHERLKHAVLAELGRLHRILDGAEADRLPQATPDGYAVQPVLADLVALRRSRDGRLDVDVEDGLRARGDAAVLAQVVANLLANCDRHAPGAPVTVRAYPSAGQVVVEVRDEGPGLPAEFGHHSLHGGLHDPAAGGAGLGLHLSARLIERAGGELDLRAGEPVGCVATVRLPAARPSLGHSAPTR